MSLSTTAKSLMLPALMVASGAQAHGGHHNHNHHQQHFNNNFQEAAPVQPWQFNYGGLLEEHQSWQQQHHHMPLEEFQAPPMNDQGHGMFDMFSFSSHDFTKINYFDFLWRDRSHPKHPLNKKKAENVPSEFLDFTLPDPNDVFDIVTCGMCKSFTQTIRDLLDLWYVHDALVVGFEYLCPMLTSYGQKACDGIIMQQVGDAILPWVHYSLMDELNLCTFSLQLCDMDHWDAVGVIGTSYQMVREKPKEFLDPSYVDQLYDKMVPRNKSELIKIAMVSDFHVDWAYTPGATNECSNVACCRADSGFPEPGDEKKAAGKWGDYLCDIPVQTLDTMFDYIRDDLKPDAIFWGGDTIPHNLDTLTNETNIEIMKNVTERFVNAVPDLKHKIFPTLGNHDTYPQDCFSMTSQDTNFQAWAPSWLQFIDDDKNKEKWLNHQYFAKQLTNNTRVLSINSNICYLENWYSITAFNDPGNQLHWMIENLDELEKSGGHAIIIAHVPNLEECTLQWGHRFHTILDRYSHVISFSVYSHTHYEQFQVIRDLVAKYPVGVGYITSSATSFTGKPPSFDVVYLDPDTMRPVDYEIYAMDLDAANANDTINWYKFFDYRTGYNMTDLRPSNYMKIAERVLREHDVCKLYDYNRFVGGPTFVLNSDCGQIDNFCQIVSAEEEEKYHCQGQTIKMRFRANNGVDTLANFINNQWYVPHKMAETDPTGMGISDLTKPLYNMKWNY